MLKAKFGVMALAVCACSLTGMIGFLVFEMRGLEERLARLEAEAPARGAAAKAVRAEKVAPGNGGTEKGVPGAAPAGAERHDLEAVQGEMRKLNDLVLGLQTKLGEVTEKAAALEKESARHAALVSNLTEGAVAGEGVAADKKEATAAMQIASTKAWMQSELEKISDAVGLTDAQKDLARAALKELMAKYFPKDGQGENAWAHWNEFNKEYKDALRSEMTAEQKNQYATYEKKQIQEQVTASASWTVNTLEEACGINSGQRDRISAKVKEYYTTAYAQYAEGGSEANMAQAYDPKKLKESLRSELSAEQMPKFEEWFKTFLGGGNWGESK